MATVKEKEECHFFGHRNCYLRMIQNTGLICNILFHSARTLIYVLEYVFSFLSKIKQLHGRYLSFFMLGVHCKYSVFVYI